MSPDSVLHMLQRVLKRAALPRIRFHDLRHTFATMALQNGVDVKTVSSMLGHYSGPGVKFCVSDFRQSQEWRWKAGRILA